MQIVHCWAQLLLLLLTLLLTTRTVQRFFPCSCWQMARRNERTGLARALRAEMQAAPPRYLTVQPLLPALPAKLLFCLRAAASMGATAVFLLHPVTRSLLQGTVLMPMTAVIVVQTNVGATFATALCIAAAALAQLLYCLIVAAIVPDSAGWAATAIALAAFGVTFLEISAVTKRFFAAGVVVSLMYQRGGAPAFALLAFDVAASMLLGCALGIAVMVVPSPSFTTAGREVGVRLRRVGRGIATQMEALVLAYSHRNTPASMRVAPTSLLDLGTGEDTVGRIGGGARAAVRPTVVPLPPHHLPPPTTSTGTPAAPFIRTLPPTLEGVPAFDLDMEAGDNDGGSASGSASGRASVASTGTGSKPAATTRTPPPASSGSAASEVHSWQEDVTHGGAASRGGSAASRAGAHDLTPRGGAVRLINMARSARGSATSFLGDGGVLLEAETGGLDEGGTAALVLQNMGTGERAPLLRADIQDMHARTGAEMARLVEAMASLATEPALLVARCCRTLRPWLCCTAPRASGSSYRQRLRQWVAATDKLQRVTRSAMVAEQLTRSSPTHAAMLHHVEGPVCALVRAAAQLHQVALAASARMAPSAVARAPCARALPGVGIAGEARPSRDDVDAARDAVASATTGFFEAFGAARAAIIYRVDQRAVRSRTGTFYLPSATPCATPGGLLDGPDADAAPPSPPPVVATPAPPVVEWHALDFFAINAFLFFILRYAQSVRAMADALATPGAVNPDGKHAPSEAAVDGAAVVCSAAARRCGWAPSWRAATRGVRVALSVLVAVLATTALERTMGSGGFTYWAPLSCAFLAGGSDGGTFKASVVRFIGTLVGAAYSYIVVRFASGSLAAVGTAASVWVAAMQYPRVDAANGQWAVVSSFTAAVVMVNPSAYSGGSADAVALIRIEQTVLGIAAYVLVHNLVLPVRARDMVAERSVAILATVRDTGAALVTEFSRFMHHELSGAAEGVPTAGAPPRPPFTLRDPLAALAPADAFLASLPDLFSEAQLEPQLSGVPFDALRRHWSDLGDAAHRAIRALRVMNQCLAALHGQAALASPQRPCPPGSVASRVGGSIGTANSMRLLVQGAAGGGHPSTASRTAPPPSCGAGGTPRGGVEHAGDTDRPSLRGLVILEPMWKLIVTVHGHAHNVLEDAIVLLNPALANQEAAELPGGDTEAAAREPDRRDFRERAPSTIIASGDATGTVAAAVLIRLPLLVDDMLAAMQVYIAAYNGLVHSLKLEAAAARETDAATAAAAAAATAAAAPAAAPAPAAPAAAPALAPAAPAAGGSGGDNGGERRREVAARMPLSNLDSLCFTTLSFAVIQLVEAVADVARLGRRLYHAQRVPLGAQ